MTGDIDRQLVDDDWLEHVCPLILELEERGIDPVEWASAKEIDWDTMSCDGHCAIGYMQATSTLTGRSWAEQLEDHRKDWDEAKVPAPLPG